MKTTGRRVRAKHRKSGFSLVEVALALLVVAIGLTAVFGLFPAGMQASRTSIDETEVSEFADFVLETLAVIAHHNWTDLSVHPAALGGSQNVLGTRIMGVPAPSNEQRIRAGGPSPNSPNLYVWQLTNTEIHRSAPPLDTRIHPSMVGHNAASFTYILRIDWADPPANNVKYARLHVWPGDRTGVTPPITTATPGGHVFYREYRRTD